MQLSKIKKKSTCSKFFFGFNNIKKLLACNMKGKKIKTWEGVANKLIRMQMM
jgi:hypothetical protein